jgi:hypothetical protein
MVTWMMLMIGFATVREAGLKISEHLEPGWPEFLVPELT